MKYSKLSDLLQFITENNIIPAISVAIGKNSEIVYLNSHGSVYETGKKVTNEAKFDIASMTKIFTGICFMNLVENSLIGLYDPISEMFPELRKKKAIEKNGNIIGWCDASKVTWFQALTHTTGMGWTRPKSRPSLPNLDKGLQDIFDLPFAYMPGEHIVYSDLPIILMGVAMEKITGKKLDTLVEDMICNPLGMKNTGFRRISKELDTKQEIIPTEEDTVFRKRRIWGEVHDENAYLLDGVAAHAGIFSNAYDMCKLMLKYAEAVKEDGLLRKTTANYMIMEQVKEDGDRRGIVWQLSGRGGNAYTKFLSSRAYGHAGFTGCFGWNDPERDLSIVLLSNDIYNGRENRKLFNYRAEIIKTILSENEL